MKLYGSLTSPYVRKVRIALIEHGLEYAFVTEGPTDAAGNVARLNPLGKVPVLVRDDGEALFDSPMIVDYLDSLMSRPLIPSGSERWRAQRWHALGQGMLDATVTRLMETRRAPDRQDPAVIHRQEDKIAAALRFADDRLGTDEFLINNAFGIADIALGVALGYLDLRYTRDWRGAYPRLTRWFSAINRRPSFTATAPPAA